MKPRLDLPDGAKAPSPVEKLASDFGEVLPRRGPHTRVLHEENPVALPGQCQHDLLVALPDVVPVYRGDADYVLTLKHKLHAHAQSQEPYIFR